MQILIFAHFAGSPYHGMVYGHYYLAREWVKLGHQVTIVAASFAHTRFIQPAQTGKIYIEEIDGVRYLWLPTPDYDPKSSLGRVRNILTYTVRCQFAKLPISQADLVVCSSHHPFPIYAARGYAKKFNAKLVFEVRDLWPLTLIELGGTSKRNPFIAIMQRAEDYAYKHADKVVSVLPGAADYMVSRGMKPEKFIYIPNGANLSEQTTKKSLPAIYIEQLKEIRDKHHFIIGYVGKIGLSNALHTLIEALALCSDRQIAVAILGSGAYAGNLKLLSTKLCVSDRVFFFEQVEKEMVQSFFDYVDVAYAGALKNPLYRFGMSLTKLNDFMLAAKPILYGVEAPGNVVEESSAGISCPAENPQVLSQAIQTMKNLTPAELSATGKRGREWVIKNRDYRVLAGKFLDAVMQ
jgi:glycosyltransferase involved in cell wall biosynthesis